MPRPRVLAPVVGVLALGAGIALRVPAAILGVLGRRRDEANIQRLAFREGCSIEDARRLYVLARRDGYGAAHREVFGTDGSQRRPAQELRGAETRASEAEAESLATVSADEAGFEAAPSDAG